MSKPSKLKALQFNFVQLPKEEQEQFRRFANICQIMSNKPKPPKFCPHCRSAHFVKNGTKCGSQRYLCRFCNKSFTAESKTILYGSQKERLVWHYYVFCFLRKLSLRETARMCEISLPTAFAWRHKLLDCLKNMFVQQELQGIVQADEMYFSRNNKGQRWPDIKKFYKRTCTPEQDSEQRAEYEKRQKALQIQPPKSTRGISDDKFCLTFAVDQNRKLHATISNRGNPSSAELKNALQGKIKENATLVTDSKAAYKKVALDFHFEHIKIPPKQHKQAGYTLSLVNNAHRHFRTFIEDHLMGVATKYLPNYIVYFQLTYCQDDLDEKQKEIFDFIDKTYFRVKIKAISKRPLYPTFD
ncbi:IS1595 family transposase [Lonepinella koalarum]|uniref:IS1595 family transposase n=1 Tax=Lonepinella koalarum TaxID=53417 RepID=UPI0011E477A4|nr:IS1595 family transposase [Lonepinella koalarum]TYG33449.1 IS1595 family transposase [Lonepinella koalarum]